MGASMTTRATSAGGCFLTLCILIGFVAGAYAGEPMKYVLIGTGVGIALALLVWVIDRHRGGAS